MRNLKRDIVKSGLSFFKHNKDIVMEAYRLPVYNDEPQLYQYTAIFKDEVGEYIPDESIASGVSFSKRRALQKLIGETIERYALTLNNKKLILGKESDLVENHIEIDSLLCFIPSVNFKTKQVLLDKKIRWVKGESLLSKSEILLPAQLIHIPYKFSHNEPTIRTLSSTGAALAMTHEEAVYRAICEVIERDSFMIHYLNKLSSPLIDLLSINDVEIRTILDSIERYNLELFLVDTMTDLGVPSVAAIVIDRTGLGAAVSVGLKAGYDIKSVIIGAIEESLMTRSWIRDNLVYSPKKINKTTINTLEQRAYYWLQPKNIKKMEFWLKSKNIKSINEYKKVPISKQYDEIIKTFREKKIDIYVVELENEEMLGEGIHVVKVVVPDLQPIHLDETMKYTTGKRLYQVPVKIGLLKHINKLNQLNKIPHPFL